MDPTSAPINPTELYELLGIVGGVIVSGLLGFVVVRRARASRQRMIDAAEAPVPRLRDKKKGRAIEAPEEEEEAPEEEAAPEAAAPPEHEPAPAPTARKPARPRAAIEPAAA